MREGGVGRHCKKADEDPALGARIVVSSLHPIPTNLPRTEAFQRQGSCKMAEKSEVSRGKDRRARAAPISHTRTQQGFWVCRATTELPCRKLFRPQIGQSAGRFSNGPTDLVARACLVRPHLTHLTHLTHGTAAGLQAGGPLSSLQLRGWLRLRVGAFAAHGSWSVRRRGLPVPQVIAPDGLALSVVRRSPTPAARPRTLICVVVTAEDSASFFVVF